jgi:hypothetical protein
MQNAGSYLAMSIATTLVVPDHVADEGEESAVKYVKGLLGRASSLVPGLSFDVQIGPNETPDEE